MTDENERTLRHERVFPAAPAQLGQQRGELVGRYLLLDELGRGGVGAVFAAWDTDLGRRVAVKLLLSAHAAEHHHVRLRREAQAMARLSHPNVVAVYDVGTYRGGVFIAMEMIDGGTLGEWLKTPRRPREVLDVLVAAGRGLAAAHAAGLVHRDFKPGNVLLGKDGRVVVTDFGLARSEVHPSGSEVSTRVGSGQERTLPLDGLALRRSDTPPPAPAARATPLEGAAAGLGPRPLGRSPSAAPSAPGSYRSALRSGSGEGTLDERVTLDDRMTHDGAILGTVGYMAPEQLADQRDDSRSDQFAYCVTLYRALYGKMPFDTEDVFVYARAVAAEEPRSPPGDSKVPGWLWPIVRRGLSRRPEDRYPSMDALLLALGRDPTRARRRWFAAAGAGALLMIGGGIRANQARAERQECAAAANALQETWNPGARESIATALTAAQKKLGPRMPEDTPGRVLAALESYVAGWRTVREQTCLESAAGGALQADLTSRRVACLDRGREHFGLLVAQLGEANETIAPTALRAALGLQRADACRAPAASERPWPVDAESRARFAAQRQAMSRSDVLRVTGQMKEALVESRRAADLARSAGDGRAEGAALLRTAALQATLGEPQATMEEAMTVIAAAERSGDDATAGRAAAMIANQLGDRLDRPKEAERWIAVAEAKLARVGRDDDLEMDTLSAKALWTGNSARPEDALPLYDRLAALQEQAFGPVSERVLVTVNNKALTLASIGRLEEALELHRRAIALGEQLFGPSYLDLSVDYQNMAVVLVGLGRYPEAEVAAQRSYDLRLVLGPTSIRLAWPLSVQSGIAMRTGHVDRSLELANAALALADARPDAAHGILASVLIHRGEALLERRRFEEAAADCRRALGLIEAESPLTPEDPTDEPITCLGRAVIGLGRLEEGLAHLERAVSLTKREEKVTLALSRFALAKALTSAGRDAPRARKLAEQAAEDLRRYPALGAKQSQVERWLASPFGIEEAASK